MSTFSTSSSSLLQDLVGDLYSRRLLLIHSTTVYQPPSTAEAPSPSYNTVDANVILVLSVVICGLICSLALNSIIRCTLRRSAIMSSTARHGGVKRKAVKSFATMTYAAGMNLDTECVICLSEFSAGERVRLLPKCHHGFHVRCIDKWLSAHSSCPTCRNCLIDTCQKIVGATTTEVPAAAMPVAFHVVNIIAPEVAMRVPAPVAVLLANIIEPLAPEAMLRNYRGII